jgi:DNA-binding CsgD family transcriptional regulator
MKKDPFYSNFLWSMDLGYAAATHVPLPSGDSLVISLERCRKDGPVPTEVVQLLTSLRPHIARSAHLSARYSFERVLSANRAFALTGLPSAAVSIQGKVIDSNEPFNQRFAASLSTSERLRLCGPETNRALDDCLAALHAGAEGGPMARRSIALPRTDTTESAVLHLVPAEGFARDVFACAALFVILTPLDATRLAPVELIQGLFDLTTMEARVARALATGSDIGSTAEGFGISRETVRAHLKSIFAKTGFTRQTDLATAISLVRTIE